MGFLKYFSPQVLEVVSSPINGEIKVMQDFNSIYLATGFWTQSGGLIKDLWESPLSKIHPLPGANWLVLGLSGGTAAQIISHNYSPAKIVGVEIDPIMVELGKKYLKLGQIPNLEIKVENASRYMANARLPMDYILVDMYVGDKPPAFVYEPSFLKQLYSLGRVCIFNHLFYYPHQKQAAEELVEKLEKIYGSVKLQRKLANLLIICENPALGTSLNKV